MDFTYNAYTKLISKLREEKYVISTYHNWKNSPRCVILRHDIDTDILKALELAKLENSLKVQSTYFVLVTSDFYNVFSDKSSCALKAILNYGHEIGLHFDEVRYPGLPVEKLKEKIIEESRTLELAIGNPVKTVSMHRPSKSILEANLDIPGIINSYGDVFFNGFKYLSDSRRRWREPVEEIIESGNYDRLHILTHAFWYHDDDQDIHKTIRSFVNQGNIYRYCSLKENITDIESIMDKDEVLYE